MSQFSPHKEKELLERLKQNDHSAFSLIFREYYKDLVYYGGSIIPEKELVEDIIQNLFLKLWNERQIIIIETSFKSYLLKAVKNSCLDELRHREIVNIHQEFILQYNVHCDDNTYDYIFHSDLKERLDAAILQLPPNCRETFELSRLKGMKYKDIALKQNISVRTVDVRISKALSILRFVLKDFLSVLLF